MKTNYPMSSSYPGDFKPRNLEEIDFSLDWKTFRTSASPHPRIRINGKGVVYFNAAAFRKFHLTGKNFAIVGITPDKEIVIKPLSDPQEGCVSLIPSPGKGKGCKVNLGSFLRYHKVLNHFTVGAESRQPNPLQVSYTQNLLFLSRIST